MDAAEEAAAMATSYVAELQQRSAARTDPKQHQHQAPTGYRLRGVSTLLDAGGEVVQTWVKTAVDHDDPAAMISAFKHMVEAADIKARPPVPAPPPEGMDDLLSVYAFGDPHIGMLAWSLETGESFDLQIAEHLMTTAVDKLVSLAPPTKRALIISPGDTFHSDGIRPQTTSGTPLDVDSRMGKVFRVAITTITRCIDRALELHDEVEGKFVVGNHDGTLSLLLPLMLSFYYRENPRVVIDTSPSPFMWYRFGKCFLATTHSDKIKLADLGEIMACDRPQDWGETEFRHWYVGHLHHRHTKELRGCTVEVLPTLASKDAWHHAHGYRAQRTMKLDIWHRNYGLKQTHQVGVEELR